MLTYCGTTPWTNEEDRISGAPAVLEPDPFEVISGMRLAQGEPSHQTELSKPTPWLGEAGQVSRLAEELALALGCPVDVMYLEDTREVLAVAHPEPGRVVRVTLPVSPLAIRLMDNPFAGLTYDLLKQLRYQISQGPADS